ncbi:hypothetical protein [Alkalihalobacillus trypoxylicola]|uniref:Uncharacterized protein n=1 Tax=Alkalihalobacillus trypoxylicola TaxID=519424 RepID=A0A162F4G3_9BACI|nr:hypothetical protein [Alkalihalobacillus trypoxylicola]KYG34785.1 hypothetical protein AZF04_00165 [Alkalihalobacillus trypoxylicola]
MNQNVDQKIIDQYQMDERMMILIYSQWCINQGLNPFKLYEQAYPDQFKNPILKEVQELTVSKEEAGEINNETLLNVLSLFGNDELAFVVTEEIKKQSK